MKPYKHQKKEFDKHKDDYARALFWQMRTGKSKAMIDAADYLYATGKISKVFIVAPNGVHLNWAYNEIPKHTIHDNRVIAPWISSQKATSKQLIETAIDFNGLSWLCVNMEVIITDLILRYYLRLSKSDLLLIVDESHHFGKPGSKRTKRIRAMARKAKYRRILSGTAAEDSPLQLFSQFEILEKGALGFTSLSAFAEEYAITIKGIYREASETLAEG